MNKIPFLLLGDGPAEPTGLGRIARDLAGLIAASDLPLDLIQVGGSVPPVWTGGWAHVPLDRQEDWGAANVTEIYRSVWGSQPGILFAVWDPARLFTYADLDIQAQKWCYTAIDGANVHGRLSGPAKVALERFDRVLAYNRYGAEVLRETLGHPISYLPHGIHTKTWAVATDVEQYARDTFGPYALNRIIIGCVMTNQPRKDHSLLFEAASQLLHRGYPIHVWLHTDVLIKDWAIAQLVDDFGLAKRVTVTGGVGQVLNDIQLAALYQACTVTVLPSLGEGFGYPIVESLAAGTPCVHVQHAGGEIYIPKAEWKVPVRERRIESVYAIVRPVTRAEDWANAIERAIKWRQAEGEETTRAYCRGAVANLDWTHLRGRWHSWLKAGLQ